MIFSFFDTWTSKPGQQAGRCPFSVLSTLCGVILTSVTLTGCGSSATPEQAAKPAKKHVDLLRSARMDTAHMERANNELSLTGKVTFNQDQVVKVFPLVGGHIQVLRADLGDYVKKGQVLAIIQSGDLADLEQEGVRARGELAMAQKNMQVTEGMNKAGFSSDRELVTSREQLLAARGEVNRVSERRRILGGKGSSYVVKAPMSGFIVEKTATAGMELRSDDTQNLFTISNLDRVWVLANVYESDLSHVHEGDPALITTISYPDKVFKGHIDKIFNVLDPNSKTMKVRVTLDNADYRLKPEMFANVNVTYAGKDERVTIPAGAVVFDKNRNYVVAVDQQNNPVVREISLYRTVGDKTYLTGGLAPGDRVVSHNQLLIYNALGN